MGQGEIMDELEQPRRLKDYLLGTLPDEAVQSQIEERLMLDEEFAVRVSAAEDELIEQFLDGELSDTDADRFQKFFLAPPERRSQFRLTRDLRRVAVAKANVPSPQPTRSQSVRGLWTGWLRFSAAAAAILIAALGIWRFAIYESDADKGLDALRAAYRDQRPVEARITGLSNYAPYSETRGGNASVTDSAALDKANRYLLDATTDSGNAAAHQALAMYYLAGGDMDRAEREINAALEKAPNDARIQSDAAAISLEAAKRIRDDDARKMILLDESIRRLNQAIALDSKLREPRFNRAICLGLLLDTEEAKSAWREYIQLDPDSKWSEEARQNLDKLEHSTPRERSSTELESDFLAAFRSGDDASAGKLISENRELIRDKYLPVRLAMSFAVGPEDRRDELLRALEYSGEIELKLTGDPFAKEIAFFYRHVSKARLEMLSAASTEMRTGIEDCRNEKYEDALPRLKSARAKFEQAGDVSSANLARYFAGYATKNMPLPLDAARAEFSSIEEWAREHNFPWLRMTALHWVGQCLIDLKELSAARRTFEEALAIADRLGDSYGRQRNLITLAQLHSMCGQNDQALRYMYAALKDSDKPQTSLRQRYRNLFLSLPILSQAKLLGAVGPASMEAVKLADQLQNPIWMPQSRTFAGTAAAETGNLLEARTLFEESTAKASAIPAAATRDMVNALTKLKSGDVELGLKNFSTAEQLYSEAVRYYDSEGKFPLLREQAHQGLLLTYLRSGKPADQLEQQIASNIEQTDEYRDRIDGDMSLGFFDLRGNVYDVASEFEFDRGNIEKAYNYAEQSSSRSLLSQMRKGISDPRNVPGLKNASLDLSSIREGLPGNISLLQFSVFESKTIAWAISRDSFDAIPISISRHDLEGKVSAFARSIALNNSTDKTEASTAAAELYRLLIQPALTHLKVDHELCIIPSDVLFDVPFAALVAADGRPLIASFPLLTAPSANVFLESTRNASERSSHKAEAVLAVGNPAFPREKFERLPDLVDAEAEAAEIRQLYSGDSNLLRRGDATKSSFLRAIPMADVVHFAGHYIAMPGSPMSSFLLLAADGDDPSGSELSNLELQNTSIPRTRLMVFAACDSGIESYYRNEGMAGMARTVLAAQVPLVVASQWSVDSAATAKLMMRFHEMRQKEHMSTTFALRAAQLELFNDPTGRFSSPYYWAGFAVYGGHADF
jgi:CHAT domain-containing protein